MKSKVNFNPRIKPDPVAAEIRRIGSLADSDLPAAETEALKLLKANPNRPDVHNMIGVIRVRQGKRPQAVPDLEFAVKAEPENTHYLNNLGRVYLDLRFVELALPFLHKALAIDPKLASALLAIGKYYSEVGKPELALPYIERLHKIMPSDPGVNLELADILDVLNRKDEVSTIFRELHRTKSSRIAPLYHFARNNPPTDNAELIGEINELLHPDTSITDKERGMLHAALGFIYEKKNDYPTAFSHFQEAGQLRSVPFNIEEYRAWVDGVIKVFSPDFFRARAHIGNPSSLPVLVVGMPRSGTTLTEQMIANHGQAEGAGELERIRMFATRLSYASHRDINKFILSLDALGSRGLREMGDNYVDLLKFHAPKALRVVDKLPHNFEHLGFAALMCPNARIIQLARNPVDTCWSCFQNPLNDHHAYSRSLTDLGLYYREFKRLMDHWKAVLPVPIYELNYEKLTGDFENEARKVIDFIGLPWDEACLNFHEAGRSVRTLSRDQVRNPIYQSSVERWRRYEAELQPLLTALGDLVQSKSGT